MDSVSIYRLNQNYNIILWELPYLHNWAVIRCEGSLFFPPHLPSFRLLWRVRSKKYHPEQILLPALLPEDSES